MGGVGLLLSYVRVSVLLAVRYKRPPKVCGRPPLSRSPLNPNPSPQQSFPNLRIMMETVSRLQTQASFEEFALSLKGFS